MDKLDIKLEKENNDYYGESTNKILTSDSDFHRLGDLAQGGIITQVEIKNIKQLVEILKNRNYKIKQE